MKAASVHEIKQQLKELPAAQLADICLRLARYKKENKELLTYLLFEAQDEEGYIRGIKEEIDEGLATLNTGNLFVAKKSLRKMVRTAAKYVRFTGSKVVEVEVLLHFCQRLKAAPVKMGKSTALANLYQTQLKKIKAAVAALHEDLQYDYKWAVEQLEHRNTSA